MESTEQLPTEVNGNDLPVVLLHRTPEYDLKILSPLLKKPFNFIDSLDESNPLISSFKSSIRLMLCVATSKIDSKVLDEYPALECIVCMSTGLNNVDLVECRRRGIRVTNAGDAFAIDVADYAVGLLIDVLRRVSFGDRFVRSGTWGSGSNFPLGFKVSGKRIGIVGLGNIGMRIAKRLEAFGCSIAYHSRRIKSNVSYTYYPNVVDLASKSDVLIVSCPLVKETYHIINKEVMRALGKEGVLINIGRGSHIDEKELVHLLVQGEIGGAGLDVFEDEPNVPPELWGMDNVVLSPHRAVLCPETFSRLQEILISNIHAFFSNKPLLTEVALE